MIDKELLKNLRLSLEGSTCIRAEFYVGFLQLDLADFRFIVQSSWRLISAGQISVGSGSTDSVQELAMNSLEGKRLVSIVVVNDFGDLRLEFANGIVLETFSASDAFEHWSIARNGAIWIVAGPGILWSSF